MKTIIILITLIITTTTISCEKDTTTICENLLEEGSADAALLKGEWEFEYFAYTPNGKRIEKNEEILDSWMEIEDICDTNSNDTCYMWVYSVNSIRYIYTLENNNGISFNLDISTEVRPSEEEEEKLTNALANIFCYVIKDNELLFHYKKDDDGNNILILKKR